MIPKAPQLPTTSKAIKVLDDEGHGSSWRLAAAFDWLLVNAEQPGDLGEIEESHGHGLRNIASSRIC